MPILAIYALIAASAIFGVGYGIAWEQQQYKIAALEDSIATANERSKRLLTEETDKVTRLAADQETSNLSLEAEHAKNLELLRVRDAGLNDARRVWANHQPRCANAVPKADNSGVSEKDNGGGTWLDSEQLSERVGKLVKRAETRDIDCHAIIETLSNIPQELIK